MQNNEFYLVFSAQQKLFSQSIYTDLYSVFRRDSFSTIARKLATKFAHDSFDKDTRIEQLFRLWLVLAPIFDRIPGIYRTNWSKSNFISLIGYLTSQLTKYYYLQEIPLEIYDITALKEGLQTLHIIDKNFANKTIEIYKAYYGSNNAIGKFSRVIFNKIFFANFAANATDNTNKIKLLQRYNKIVKLSKTLFTEKENASKPPLAKPKNTNRSKNIMRESVDIWDYQLSRHIIKDKTSTKRESKIKIILSNKAIMEIKERLMACKREKEIIKTCETFTEKHKYVFMLNNQFLFLNEFLHKYLSKHTNIKTRYNIYQRYIERSEIIKNLPKQATTQYLASVFTKDYQEVDQDVFLYTYFNPYKEL